ncbi:MAG: CAP domain-containing protein [Candidatus Zambryskibacteria bacterium]|nr:CAP domain-containing protein [Candidatus Zambryskibacteria bacterium]
MKKQANKKIKVGALVVFLAIVLILFLSTFFPQSKFVQYISEKGSQFANIISGVLVLNTNDYRLINNENSLTVSDTLTQAAQMKANDMAKKSYFSHTGPLGERPWVWFERVGYKYEYAGENLAIDFTESNDVSQAWIDSAKHKANLLNPNFTEIGIGIADGIYEGHNTTFVVQFFGKPYQEKTVLVASPTIKTIKLNASSSPTMAVATRNDLPVGEVLGTEAVSSETGKAWVWVLGVFALISVVGYGVYTRARK